ncbi:MAG: lytic transglycosylase domain-containing protein [Pseudomonadota bacterium]
MVNRRTNLALGGLCVAAALIFAAPTHAASPAPRLKPPAPGPTYLTRLDQARLKTVQNALKRKAFALAKAETQFIEDATARSLGDWLYFMSKDPQMDFREAGVFLDAHPDWPSRSRIQSFAESRIADDAPAADILAFFTQRKPRTGAGKTHMARALLSQGRDAEATALIRDAWVNHNFRIAEEKQIIKNYSKRLTKADHASRVDRLLWGRQVTNARRTFPYLSREDRRMAEARAALLLRAGSGPKLYRQLKEEEQKDSGVLYAAVRYYRRTDEQQYAIALAGDAPEDPSLIRNSDRWWTERRLLLQWAIKEGRFADAYAVAARHGISAADNYGDFADAEFVAGWIALRFLDAPARAETHFQILADAVKSPISLSRAHYWLGRAADAKGDNAAARAHYANAAQYQYSYYGQLAVEALSGEAPRQAFASAPIPTAIEKARFASRPAVTALRMLSDLDLDYEFMIFAYHIDDQLESPGEYVELARLTNGEGAPHLTVRAGKVAVQRGAFVPDVAYPMRLAPSEARAYVAPEIILGLSRQESEFNPRAYSSAGARGVMQLIPSTAQITARKEGLPYRRSALLDDPLYNMTIGAAHLSHLLDRFDGSLILTFAAYNAGAHRAAQWIEDFGDPRTGDVEPLDWVEMIPFSETRNYVQRVLENVQVYRARLNDAPMAGRLSNDIELGGPSGRVAANAKPSTVLAARAITAGPGNLAPLPSRTAQLAAAAAARRLAAPSAAERITAPSKTPIAKERATKTPAPGLRPDPVSAIAAAPAPSTTQQDPKTANITGAPTSAPAPMPSPSPSTEPPAQTTELPVEPRKKPALAQKPLAKPLALTSNDSENAPPVGAAPAPADPADKLEQAPVRTQAAAMVNKAAERLDVRTQSETDALAAAIARGLEDLTAEGASNADPTKALSECASVEAADTDPAEGDAEDLNARMLAALEDDEAGACAAHASP